MVLRVFKSTVIDYRISLNKRPGRLFENRTSRAYKIHTLHGYFSKTSGFRFRGGGAYSRGVYLNNSLLGGALIRGEGRLFEGRGAYSRGGALIRGEGRLFEGRGAYSRGGALIRGEGRLFEGRGAYSRGGALIRGGGRLFEGGAYSRKYGTHLHPGQHNTSTVRKGYQKQNFYVYKNLPSSILSNGSR